MNPSFFILSSEQERPLLSEIWEYFTNASDVSSYENLGFGTNSMISIPAILVAFAIGMIIASVAATFNKRVLGELVRQMIYQGAVGMENAKTLEELGFSGNRTIAQALRRGVTLRRVVKCAEETEHNEQMRARREEYERRRETDKSLPPFKQLDYEVNTRTDRFYIPEEEKFAAETKFEKKGSSWVGVAITSAVALALLVALLFLTPKLLNLLDSFVGSLK